MTGELIDAIKDKLGIVDVIREVGGANIHQNGAGWSGHHLAHGSSSGASLKVDPKLGLYNCFGCGQSGDIFSWVGFLKFGDGYRNHGEMFDYSLRECARLAGVEIKDREVDVDALAERRRLEEIFALVADFYHDSLPGDQREWLRSRYGLTDATIDRLKLGFAPASKNALFVYLRKRKNGTDDLLKTGLFHQFDSGGVEDLFQGRLIFPYWRRGNPVYFIGRETDLSPQWEKDAAGMKYKKQMVHKDEHPYVSKQVRNDYFYGEDAALGADTLLVTEGVTDCIIANQAGFPCISPVTIQFRKADHPRLLTLTKHAGFVYIVNDNEANESGRKGALATAEALWNAGKVARFIELPRPADVDKIDLNDFLREHTAEDLRALLPTGKTLLDLRIADALSTKDGKHVAPDTLPPIFALLARVTDKYQRNYYRGAVTDQLGITKSAYDEFLTVALEELRDAQRGKQDRPEAEQSPTWPYGVENGRIVHYVTVENDDGGTVKSFPLCNFDARIVADVLHDDGEEVERHISITGTLQTGQALPEITISAADFEKMNWVVEGWGARAAIEPGKRSRDQLRHAIQKLSGANLQERRVFTHTGWRLVDGKRIFLHAGGAVGSDAVQVKLPGNLRNYVLPSDGTINQVDAMRASIALLDIADHHVTYPLWAAQYLAPLASIIPPSFVEWFEGESGSQKSTLCALFLCHFGAAFDEFGTPADWISTANSLEKLAFHAKDVPLLIDDFRPSSNKYENQQMQAAAQRIIRGTGNRQGRGRLDSNSDFRRTFEPRGMVIATAERGALGKSTAARVMTVTVRKGDVDLKKLTAAQQCRSVYGYAMAGYLRFVAEHWDMLARDLPPAILEERTVNGDGLSHLRLPNAMAALYVAFDLAMQYALEIGAVDDAEVGRRCAECKDILRRIAEEQSELVESQDPARIYIETLITLLRQGKIKFVSKPAPEGAHEAGYGAIDGERQGWHDGEHVYLLPSAYNTVCRYVAAEGSMFPSDEATLRKELGRAGYLVESDEEGRRSVRKRDEEGRLLRVVAVLLTRLLETAKEMRIETSDLYYRIDREPSA